MRKIVLSLAAAGAALLAASPAAAQYYPQPQPALRLQQRISGMAQVAAQVRIDNIQRQINRLDRRDRIGDNSADRLRDEARDIERRLHKRARGGLDNREAGEVAYRVQRLEQRVQIALNNRYDRRDRRW